MGPPVAKVKELKECHRLPAATSPSGHVSLPGAAVACSSSYIHSEKDLPGWRWESWPLPACAPTPEPEAQTACPLGTSSPCLSSVRCGHREADAARYLDGATSDEPEVSELLKSKKNGNYNVIQTTRLQFLEEIERSRCSALALLRQQIQKD